MKNGVPFASTQNDTVLAVEVACDASDELWLISEEELKGKIMQHISGIFGVLENDVVGYNIFKTEFGYLIYSIGFDKLRREINFETEIKNPYLTGRQGQFKYILTEEAYDSGIECAKRVHGKLVG